MCLYKLIANDSQKLETVFKVNLFRNMTKIRRISNKFFSSRVSIRNFITFFSYIIIYHIIRTAKTYVCA